MNATGTIKDVRPARGRGPGNIIFEDGETFGCFDRDLLTRAKEGVGQEAAYVWEEKVSQKDGKTYRTIKSLDLEPSIKLDGLTLREQGTEVTELAEPKHKVVMAIPIHESTALDRLEQGYQIAKRQHELVLELLRSRLVLGTDYVDGKMFGSAKPVLLQPGAHAILQALGYSAIPVIVSGPMEAPPERNARYTIVTRVDVFNADGRQVGAAFGSASSTIWSNKQLAFVGRAVDPDKSHNSTIKMSIKRAVVAACRLTTPSAALFAEDVEEGGYGEEKKTAQAK